MSHRIGLKLNPTPLKDKIISTALIKIGGNRIKDRSKGLDIK
jgi:hypothetical protein